MRKILPILLAILMLLAFPLQGFAAGYAFGMQANLSAPSMSMSTAESAQQAAYSLNSQDSLAVPLVAEMPDHCAAAQQHPAKHTMCDKCAGDACACPSAVSSNFISNNGVAFLPTLLADGQHQIAAQERFSSFAPEFQDPPPKTSSFA